MLNKKIMILTVILVSLFAVSAVSAADNATGEAVSVEETTDEVVSVKENQVNLKENNNAGTFDDLQTEINNAPEGSVLNLTRDYNGAKNKVVLLNKNLTIDGQGHTIDCLGDDCSAFYSDAGTITLKNLKIINGHNDDNYKGGAIYIGDSAKYTIINCTFNNNWADDYGGAIYNGVNPLTIINCSFNNNKADDVYGGAVYAKGSTYVSGSSFTDNYANNYGGAIDSKNLNIINCTFLSNKADDYGGAICAYGNTSISDSSFIDNYANKQGGAIHSSGFLNITNSTFRSNKADYTFGGYGGAIYTNGSTYISGSSFIENSVLGQGGAIYSKHDLDIVNCSFTSNKAHTDGCVGGAISAKGNVVTIVGSNFTSNEAGRLGGAIFARDRTENKPVYLKIIDSSFIENCCEYDGGAICVRGNLDILNSSFKHNTVSDGAGGAIFCDSYSNVDSYTTVVDSTFIYNNAIDNGGAIHSNQDMTVIRSVFENNNIIGVNSEGGAIKSTEDVKIENSTFRNNHAPVSGGAIYADTITWVESPSYFIGNSANKKGGAIYTNKFKTNVKYGVFINNKGVYDDDGGAIYINKENHLTFSQCYFENNRCGDEGGAIYLDSTSSTLILEYNIFVDNWAGDKGNIVYNKGKYNKIHNNWYGNNTFDFSNGLVEYNFWGSDKNHKDDEQVLVELSLNETCQPSTLIVRFISDGKLFNYDAKFSADNGAILTNHKTGNNTVTSDITFDEGITTVTATVNHQVLKLSYSFSKENVTMDINAPEISFSDNATINIIFTPNNATGTVSVGNISSDVVDGAASIIIPNLSVGNHNLEVSYSGDGLYNPTQGNVTITVNRKNLNIDASAKPIHEGENATVIVTGLEHATGNVTVTINNNNWTAEIINGTATIIILGLSENTAADVTYLGDANYTNTSTTVDIIVNPKPKENLTINASANPIMVGEDATVIVNGLANATGNVTVIIGSNNWTGEINQGIANVIVQGLTENVTATVFYAGDYRYNNATTTVNITVNPAITVWYVNRSKESSGNGTTPDTAFKTLKEALNKAPENSTIYIAPGTYTCENNTNLTINKNLNFINYGMGEVIFDAQGLSRIWTVTATSINITGLTFKNGKEQSVCGAIFFNQTINNSYINAIFINNTVVEGLAGAVGFYADVINTNINSIFIENSVNNGYGGAIFFNGNLNNVNITGNYTANKANDYGGAIVFYGNLSNVNILGNFSSNKANDSGGAIFFNGNLTNVNISGSYNNNRANDTAGVFLFYRNLTNVVISGEYTNNAAQYCAVYYMSEFATINNSSISGNYYNNSADYFVVFLMEGIISNSNISGTYTNNKAKMGFNIIGEAYNVNMSGNYVNNNISDGCVIYIGYCDENSIIHDSIFINNTMDDELIIDVMSGSFLSVNNWFGNNATDYNIRPKVGENVTMTNWLFLNATANTTRLKINETAEITFKLYSYKDGEINEYDASKMNIILDLSQIHGTLNQTNALINETILYKYTEEGFASVTGKFKTASYTIILAKIYTEIIIDETDIKLNVTESVSAGATLNPPEAGNLTYTSSNTAVAVVENGIIRGLNEGTAIITVSFSGDDEYAAAEDKTINVTVSLYDASVSVNNSTLDLFVGRNFTIIATTVPAGLDVTFVPDDSGVVSVSDNGVVTALKNGTAFITVKVGGDGVYAENSTTVAVTVSKVPTNISVVADNLELKVLQNVSAGATLTPADAGNLTYTSSNESVVMVENGIIKALANGTAIVTVSFNGTDVYAAAESKTINVTVSLYDASVSVNNSTLELFVGGNFTIVATTVPEGLDVTYVVDNSGVISFDNGVVTALNEGTASIVVKVGGDGVYAENSTIVAVTVSKVPTNISVVADNLDLNVLQNVTAGATLTPADAGNLTYTSSNGSVVKVEDGIIKAIGEGTAIITVSFAGDDTYAAAENKTITVTVSLNDASVSVNNSTLDLFVGGNFTIVATTVPEGLNVTYVVDNSGVISFDNGVVTALKNGTAFITVKVGGDGVYAENSTTVAVTVKKVTPEITITDIEGTIGETVNATVTIAGGDATGMIIFDDNSYAVSGGQAIIQVTLLSANMTNITVNYTGDNKYLAGNVTKDVVVYKQNATVDVVVPSEIPAGTNATVEVFLPADAEGNVTLIVDGIDIEEVPVVDGHANFTLPQLNAGSHIIEVAYSGDDKYNSYSKSITMKVIGTDTVIRITEVTGNCVVSGVLKDIDGNVIANAELSVLIKGNVTKVTTDNKGAFTIQAQNDVVTFVYAGSDIFSPSNATITLKDLAPARMASVISAEDYTTYAIDYNAGERGGYFKVQLVDENLNPLANKPVKIGFNGKVYTTITNETGWAQLQINLAGAGTYTFAVAFLGDDDYNASFVVQKIVVNKKKTSIDAPAKSYKASAKTKSYTVTLKTDKGSSIDGKTYLASGKKITMTVNGKTYAAKTNSKGQATFKLSITKKGTFSATVKFDGDKTYAASSKSAKITIK